MKMYPLVFLFLGFALLASCDSPPETPHAQGEVTLAIKSLPKPDGNNQGRAESQTPSTLLITLKDAQGNTVLDQHSMNLFALGDGYITNPVTLDIGQYTLEEFIVLDAEGVVMYLTPIAGSEFGNLVPNPLPIGLAVSAAATTHVAVDVVPAGLGDASQYGYSTFSFNVVQVAYLRPGAAGGKDAVLSKLGTNPAGDREDIHIYAGTLSGVPNENRVAIDFDLTRLPNGVTIDSAFVSLYFNYSSVYIESFQRGPGHFNDNAFFIEKITEDWHEQTIVWDNQPTTDPATQVLIPASTSPTQDYERIDLTSIISDLYENPAEGFGMLLKLQNNAPYRVVYFASSDHPDASVHPSLTVYYH